MAKNNKSKKEKNVILVLVEGDSEKIALEGPISALFDEANPKYRVIFAKQRRLVNSIGDEQEDDDEDVWDDEYYDGDEEDEYEWGGDITSSSYVNPDNIETKITNRFFKPLVDKEKIYAKMLLHVIHIVDLDGTYVNKERIVPYSEEHSHMESPFYEGVKNLVSLERESF